MEAVTKGTFTWQDLSWTEAWMQKVAPMIQSRTLPMVNLWEGRAGLGKRQFVSAVAAMLATDETDLFWLEKDKIKIEDIDELQEFLGYEPQSGGYRVAVVVDCDGMNIQSANRLLKLLEEPPRHSMVLMTTSHSGRILPTILSRVARWYLSPPPFDVASAWLASMISAEAKDLTSRVLRESGGSPLLAYARLTEGDQHSEIDAEIVSLLEGKDPLRVLKVAENLAKKNQLAAADFLYRLEVIINRRYKQQLGEPSGYDNVRVKVAFSYEKSSEVRKIVYKAKQLAVKKQIPLNTQLLAEAVGLSLCQNKVNYGRD
jgi:DNA polymerase-3 subunit delta'